MSDDEIRIAVAECCGYKRVPCPSSAYEDGGQLKPAPMTYWAEWRPGETIGLPDYPNDLNAMHEAEKLLDEHQYKLFIIDLTFGQKLPRSHCATARQRAEAFLRTLGKWKETT